MQRMKPLALFKFQEMVLHHMFVSNIDETKPSVGVPMGRIDSLHPSHVYSLSSTAWFGARPTSIRCFNNLRLVGVDDMACGSMEV